MSDNSQILREIQNIIIASENVIPDEAPMTSMVWMNRAIGLLLWAAEIIGGQEELENIRNAWEAIRDE